MPVPGVLELSFDAGSSWVALAPALASPETTEADEGLLPVGLFSRRRKAMHSARVHSWMGGRGELTLTSCLNLCFDCFCLCDWAAVAVVDVGDEQDEEELSREGDISPLDYDSEIRQTTFEYV